MNIVSSKIILYNSAIRYEKLKNNNKTSCNKGSKYNPDYHFRVCKDPHTTELCHSLVLGQPRIITIAIQS